MLTREWTRRAQPHCVSLPKYRDHVNLEPVHITHDSLSDEWFIYVGKPDYDDLLGLIEAPEVLMI